MNSEPILLDVPDRLDGSRVVVRPYEYADVADLLAAVTGSRADLASRLSSMRDFDSLEDARRLVVQSRGWWILREDFVAGIFERTTGSFCGGVSLHPVVWDHGKFEIGYWLCLSARGRGYATEAVRLMTSLAFGRLEAQRVEIVVETGNGPSCRVADRAGYVLEGTLRRHLPASDGTLKDVNVYSLIAEDCPVDARADGAL